MRRLLPVSKTFLESPFSYSLIVLIDINLPIRRWVSKVKEKLVFSVETRPRSTSFTISFDWEEVLPSFSWWLFVSQIGMVCQSSSVYLTVFISLERFIAVCTPLQAKHLCTQFRYEGPRGWSWSYTKDKVDINQGGLEWVVKVFKSLSL